MLGNDAASSWRWMLEGIIVPMINTAQEAADLVRYTHYPHIGERSASSLIPLLIAQ